MENRGHASGSSASLGHCPSGWMRKDGRESSVRTTRSLCSEQKNVQEVVSQCL